VSATPIFRQFDEQLYAFLIADHPTTLRLWKPIPERMASQEAFGWWTQLDWVELTFPQLSAVVTKTFS